MTAATGAAVWHAPAVGRVERWARHGLRGATVWFTGLSGSGKSTLANAVAQRLLEAGRAAYVLDGDNLRHGLNADLGFSPADRTENVRRVGEVARLLTDAGLVALVPVISPYRADRARVRDAHAVDGLPFVEVFVDTPLAVCEARDPKGLYATRPRRRADRPDRRRRPLRSADVARRAPHRRRPRPRRHRRHRRPLSRHGPARRGTLRIRDAAGSELAEGERAPELLTPSGPAAWTGSVRLRRTRRFAVGSRRSTSSACVAVAQRRERRRSRRAPAPRPGAIAAMVGRCERRRSSRCSPSRAATSLTTCCGGCRQRLAEFAGPSTPVHAAGPDGRAAHVHARGPAPAAFGPAHSRRPNLVPFWRGPNPEFEPVAAQIAG